VWLNIGFGEMVIEALGVGFGHYMGVRP